MYEKLSVYLFNYSEKIFSLDLALELVQNSFKYEPENIMNGSYLLKWNEKDINYVKKYINFDNCLQIILTNKFNYKKNILIDPNYKTKYVKIKKINSKMNQFDCKIDLDNSYLNTLPKFIKKLNNQIPFEVKKNIWFGNTSKFNESFYYINILFNDLFYYKSPKNNILTQISLEILDYCIRKDLHKAIEVNFNFSLNIIEKYNQVSLHLKLLNDIKMSQNFIDNVIDKLLNNSIDLITDDFINNKIKNIKQNIKNLKNISPWDYCERLLNLKYNNSYNTEVLLKVISSIKYTDVLKHINKLFKSPNIRIFIYGNISEIPKFNLLNGFINNKNIISKFKTKIIDKIIVKHPNKKEHNNCVEIIYFVSKFNPLLILHLILSNLILKDVFYNKLRTEEQLGYLVSMDFNKINNIYYIYQKIQSLIDVDIIEKKINNFNNSIINFILIKCLKSG
jgi:hypothetical protein